MNCFGNRGDEEMPLDDRKADNGREWPRTFDLSVPNDARNNYDFVDRQGNSVGLVSNRVITSRYTLLSFLPLNLWDQFQELSNIYFLFVGFLQVWPEISTTQGVPDTYIPLAFILTVSGVRAAFDDVAKHREDSARAAIPFLVFDPDQTRKTPGKTQGKKRRSTVLSGPAPANFFYKESGSLCVGDIIMITQNQVFPADILCIATAHKKGHCFVETASLDGETNLKIKESVGIIHDALPVRDVKDDEKDEKKRQTLVYAAASEISAPLADMTGSIRFGEPDKDLEKLQGNITVKFEGGRSKGPGKLRGTNLLLRGTKLKNTAFIIGIVLYTGVDTKIRKNNEKKDSSLALKKSAIFSKVNNLLFSTLSLQIFLCLLGAIYSGAWQKENLNVSYLDLSSNVAREACLRFFTWFIILSQLVPISLVVTSELTKKFQQIIMEMDVSIWDDRKGPMKVNYGQISEDLGQVEYIFSDKTGTLTQNRMEFRLAFIGKESYGSADTDIAKRVRMKEELARTGRKPEKVPWTKTVENLEAEMKAIGDGIKFPEDIKNEMRELMWGQGKGTKQAELVHNFVTHMAISNTITPVIEGDKINYNSSSPDELALCNFGAHLGIKFVTRSGAEGSAVVTVVEDRGNQKVKVSYRLQAVLPFDSVRKRVTVIYSDMDRKNVWIMMKGADSCVEPILWQPPDAQEALEEKKKMDFMKKKLLEASNYGLRTLLVAESKKDFDWWEKHRNDFIRAKDLQPEGKLTKRQVKEMRRSAYREIELAADLKILGATAIEDQLQHLVPECIEDLLEGGIKVWMLTGDKRETAKNIAMACNLIEPDMIALKTPENIKAAGAMKKFRINSAEALSENRLVEVTGKWAGLKNDDKGLTKLFKLIDQDGDGFVERSELELILGVLKLPADQKLFDDIKSTKPDHISRDEFLNFIKSTDIDVIKALRADIKAGMDRIKSIPDLDKYPVSMVVEGGGENSALGKISEAPTEDQIGQGPPGIFDMIFPCFREEQKISLSKKDLELLLLKEDFFDLASRCKSVIACRCTPLQKHNIHTNT
ncbi:hypothetical protein AAMO2058_000222700 [Amorphochlora amoebiformis]